MKKFCLFSVVLMLMGYNCLSQDTVEEWHDPRFVFFDKQQDLHSTMSENYFLSMKYNKKESCKDELDLSPDSLLYVAILYAQPWYYRAIDIAMPFVAQKEIQIIGVALLIKEHNTPNISPVHIGITTNYKEFLDSIEVPQFTDKIYNYVELFFKDTITVPKNFYVKLSMPKPDLTDEKQSLLACDTQNRFSIFMDKELSTADVWEYTYETNGYAGILHYWAKIDEDFGFYMFPIMAETREEYNKSVGIDDTKSNMFLAVYPNPASETLQVISPYTILDVETINPLGQIIETIQVNDNNVVIDVTDYKKGMYLLNVRTQNGVTKKKVLIN